MLMQPQHPDYDFILNTNHKPKRSLLPSVNSTQSRIMIAIGGAFVLIVVAVLAFSILSGAGNEAKAQLLKSAQQQTEIIRISQQGIDRAKGAAAKNLAVTTNLSLQSDQAALLTSLKTQGLKPSPKDLALGKKQTTDTTLTNAEQSNNFDSVFIETIRKELLAYQKTLQIAYEATSSKSLKDTLNKQLQHAELLASVKQ